MKGLLIKDLRILMCQKSSMVIFIGIAMLMLIGGMDVSFCIGYATMLMTILMIGTISYDEHENCMSFLLTLPISRKEYVFSKYVFTVLGIFLVDLLMLLAICIYEMIQPSGVLLKEYMIIGVIMLAAAIMLISLLIPIDLKFGVEKSKFVMAAVSMLVGAVTILLARFSDYIPYSIRRMLEKITVATPEITMLVFGGISLVVLILSILISIRIIEKRDY